MGHCCPTPADHASVHRGRSTYVFLGFLGQSLIDLARHTFACHLPIISLLALAAGEPYVTSTASLLHHRGVLKREEEEQKEEEKKKEEEKEEETEEEENEEEEK